MDGPLLAASQNLLILQEKGGRGQQLKRVR
jgi:hypothetical protein